MSGLWVQPKKCHRVFLVKGMVNDCRPWEIGETPIHLVSPREMVQYLGVQE